MSFLKVPQAFALTPEQIVGPIDTPEGVQLFNQEVGGIGIILFISNMIRFVIILGGIWAIINLILAAFLYLTGGGKSDTHAKVSSRFTMSVIGLFLMIIAYTVAALVGYIFYGSATYIIEPVIAPL